MSAELPPAVAAAGLDPAEVRRYSRHLIMPEVGMEGQARLKQSKVLMVGAGGLGSPLGLYLAAAGVGTLGIVEFDEVEESNLHRQVLYGERDRGRPKLEVAVERLGETNPLIDIVPFDCRLDSSNALEILQDFDLVVDGSDNFPTRYLVNDACVLLGKPNVYGSIFRFEGQVSVFWGAQGPCYRCLFPEPPPPGLVPSCAEGGVLGVLPGIIGALQANEAIKLILGIGDSLIGRFVVFDALKMRFREVNLEKNPNCPVCSDNPSQTELVDYEQLCGLVPPEPVSVESAINVSAQETQQKLESESAVQLLDVRTEQEYAICRIEGATLIPLQELPGRLAELDPIQEMIVYCHSGMRSIQAVHFLREQGFDRASNMHGGISAWSREVDPTVPIY
jgi:molybdopterin/thiamine biosynthesis adenylyltransferase/rhodanese-related sulfurtransferase